MTLRIMSLVIVASTAGLVAQSPSVFRSTVDLVELDASVISGRRPVSGLTAGDFTITDNGVRQTILDVSRETMPIDLTLVIDTSDSVSPKLAESIADGVKHIQGRLRRDDQAALMTFNERVVERLSLSSAGALKSVKLGPSSGWTSLYDAISIAMVRPPISGRRQMALVFTDGFDTMSFLDEDAVIDIAGRSRTAVFVVAQTAIVSGLPREFFERLADTTGGIVQFIDPFTIVHVDSYGVRTNADENMLTDSFLRAFDDFRTRYVLHYTLTGVPRRGWHDIKVQVTKPGGTYSVRTKTGYSGS